MNAEQKLAELEERLRALAGKWIERAGALTLTCMEALPDGKIKEAGIAGGRAQALRENAAELCFQRAEECRRKKA